MHKKRKSVKRPKKGNSIDESKEPPKKKQDSPTKGEKRPLKLSLSNEDTSSEWSASEAYAE